MAGEHVKTPKGRYVHVAHGTWTQAKFILSDTPDRLSASVVCNRVPAWHRFVVVEDPVTCPKCLAWAGRRSR